MDRRKFLGLIGIGAVAGPAAAKNVLGTTSPVNTGIIMQAMPQGVPSSLSGPGGGLSALERMIKLKALISGEERQEPEPWESSNRKRMTVEHNVHALGSVSQSAKIRMLIRANDEIHREEKRGYWLRELTGLKLLG